MERYEQAINKIKEAIFDIISLSLDSGEMDINEVVADAEKLIKDVNIISGKINSEIIEDYEPVEIPEEEKIEIPSVEQINTKNQEQEPIEEESIEIKEEQTVALPEENNVDFKFNLDEEQQKIVFQKQNTDIPKAILISNKQLINLKQSYETMLATNKYNVILTGKQETKEPVDINAQIENLMQEAKEAYASGDSAKAEEIYNKVSELNKQIQ